MYPSRFGYEAPSTVDEAIGLLAAAQGEAKVLAGGQSLIPMMKLRFAAPAMLVDINGIDGPRLPPRRSRRHVPHRCALPARRP